MKTITTPITEEIVKGLEIGDMITITGIIYTGRDAVLPRIVSLIEDDCLQNYGIYLKGSVIFHSAVSTAGVGVTSSNKVEIESSMPVLSKAGVRLHLGKGALKPETVIALNKYKSIYAVQPPVTALLNKKILSRKVIAFAELGMEAMHELRVVEFPAVIAAAHGISIY
ncbi:MAG: fumarate hydratase C-terminal domain-containing protein [Lachnospiraceae bacterium]|nr:fumarate hydratase C-terminal domain-containing protein [Lachnospiraceae bacterium]